MISWDRKEALRYMGYQGCQPDDIVEEEIDRCAQQLQEVSSARTVFKTFDIHYCDDIIEIAGMQIRSKSLMRNLKGCSEAVLMACTIGDGCDRLIRRVQLRSVHEAAMMQAIGAAMVEGVCDDLNQKIKEEAEERCLYARPRFSPGYGDLPLTLQKDFEKILNMRKEIGVSVSDSLLMTPSKSVTAIIGLSPVDTNCVLSGCEECSMSDSCLYTRKENA